jgi:hypothetical protein
MKVTTTPIVELNGQPPLNVLDYLSSSGTLRNLCSFQHFQPIPAVRGVKLKQLVAGRAELAECIQLLQRRAGGGGRRFFFSRLAVLSRRY